MRINIDGLSEEELVDLNNRVVARLRMLHQMRSHAQMLEFRIGDRVTFEPEGGPAVLTDPGLTDGSKVGAWRAAFEEREQAKAEKAKAAAAAASKPA